MRLLRWFLSLGLLLLLLLLFRRQLPQMLARLGRLQPVPMLLAVGWYLIFILISAWRWQILLRARQLAFSTWYLARVFTLGLFFCKLLPTSIGGDVMRIAYTARKGKGAEAFSATFLDRVIGFVSLTFLAVVAALGLFAAHGLWAERLVLRNNAAGEPAMTMRGDVMFLFLLGILLLLVLLVLVLFSDRMHSFLRRLLGGLHLRRVAETIDRAFDSVKQFRHDRSALALSFLLGMGVQAALSLCWYSVMRALGGSVPLVYFMIFIPLLNIVVNVPSIGGLGVREASFVPMFTQPWLENALEGHLALACAMLFLGLDLVFAIIGGLLFASMRRDRAVSDQQSVVNGG
ncbi:MAG: lysylphosphatidylglycerol synthase transmembrane domain-containing protein [candidate division WOR-3 bacterium]